MPAGGTTKEEQAVEPSEMLGDSGLRCRTSTIHYAALESEYYFGITAASIPPCSNAAAMAWLLDCEGSHRYAFHLYDDPVPPRLHIHCQHQQDALPHSWDGLVADTDGSVDECTEVLGAGYVLGVDPFFARVGGPRASAHAELLVCFSCCGMCANAIAVVFTC